MEKMNAVIAFLRECATKLTDLAAELEKDDATPVAEPEKKTASKKKKEPAPAAEPEKKKKKKKPAPVTEPEKTYTFDEVRQKCALKSREGHTSEVKDAIAKFGASTLSGVEPNDYPALMEIMEGL